MKIWIGMPTGHRAKQVIDVAKDWKSKGVNVFACCWDVATYKILEDIADFRVMGKRESFAYNHNQIARIIIDWDLYICGADDLWSGNFDIDSIVKYALKYSDKILYVHDGCNSRVCTHPVITRQWWLNHNQTIYDENYGHGYCDVDLTITAARENSIIKCFDIKLDHRHPSQGKAEVDEVYKIGRELTAQGRTYFESKFGKVNIDNEVKGIQKGNI